MTTKEHMIKALDWCKKNLGCSSCIYGISLEDLEFFCLNYKSTTDFNIEMGDWDCDEWIWDNEELEEILGETEDE